MPKQNKIFEEVFINKNWLKDLSDLLEHCA